MTTLKILSNNEEVAEIFNSYFVNVADGIGLPLPSPKSKNDK